MSRRILAAHHLLLTLGVLLLNLDSSFAQSTSSKCNDHSISRVACTGDTFCFRPTYPDIQYVVVAPPQKCPEHFVRLISITDMDLACNAAAGAAGSISDDSFHCLPGNSCKKDGKPTRPLETSQSSTCCTYTKTQSCVPWELGAEAGSEAEASAGLE